MNKKTALILIIFFAVIVLLGLGLFLSHMLTPYKRLDLQDYKKQVNSSLSNHDFVEELIRQNLEQKQLIDSLESELANKDIIINYLLNRLNSTSGLETDPFSKIRREDIKVYNDRIIIYVNKAFTAYFADSKSMYPFIREGVFALEVKPEKAEDIKVGDVIGFESKAFNTTIIHRIIEINTDEQGWYAITKGDNNPGQDPGKVRFDEIVGVLVGLIY